MKHNLFLCILILVIFGLYFKNSVEHLSDDKDTLKKEINDIISKNLKNIYTSFINSLIDNKLDKIKCNEGPQGPKGDVGDKTTSYQGLYCEADPSRPLSIHNINSNMEPNSIVILRDKEDTETKENTNSFFILSNKERWQFTQNNEIKTAYMKKNDKDEVTGDYGICYNDNKEVYVCNSKNDNEKNNLRTFEYTNDSEFKTTQGNNVSQKCLTLGELTDRSNTLLKENSKIKKQLVLEDCNKNKNQKFFLH